ncbi:MAG: DMT family transporter [Gemmatimonadaceae bacterium]
MSVRLREDTSASLRGSPWSSAATTDVLLASMALIWSVNLSVMKAATGFIDPLAYNAARVALGAAAALLGLYAWRNGAVMTARRGRLVLLGMFGHGLYQYVFISGLARTRVATAALLLASTPAAVALLGRMRGVERIAARGWLGIALQLGGVALLLVGTGAAAAGGDSLGGAALILLGVLSWALYAVLLKGYEDSGTWLEITAYTLLGGALVSLAVGAPAMWRAPWATAPAAVWPAIVFSGIVSMVVATAFWYQGLRRLGPTRTSMYSNLQPLFAIAIAWIALSEVPTPWQGGGAALILGGLLLARA